MQSNTSGTGDTGATRAIDWNDPARVLEIAHAMGTPADEIRRAVAVWVDACRYMFGRSEALDDADRLLAAADVLRRRFTQIGYPSSEHREGGILALALEAAAHVQTAYPAEEADALITTHGAQVLTDALGGSAVDEIDAAMRARANHRRMLGAFCDALPAENDGGAQ